MCGFRVLKHKVAAEYGYHNSNALMMLPSLKKNLVALKTEPRTYPCLSSSMLSCSPTLPPNIFKKYYFKISDLISRKLIFISFS